MSMLLEINDKKNLKLFKACAGKTKSRSLVFTVQQQVMITYTTLTLSTTPVNQIQIPDID